MCSSVFLLKNGQKLLLNLKRAVNFFFNLKTLALNLLMGDLFGQDVRGKVL